MAEKILVVLQEGTRTLTGLEYALSLADRVKGRIYILLIRPLSSAPGRPSQIESSGRVMVDDAVKTAMETAQAAGVSVSYHQANGEVVDESVNFARVNGVHLVILMDESEVDHGAGSAAEDIRKRSGCRVMMVSPGPAKSAEPLGERP